MPVRNASPWLSECVESIINQEFTNWELIAVDDHSSDDSWLILEKYVARDQRVRALKNSDKGILPALQLALNNSNGNLITRMDADDLMPSDKLKLFVHESSVHPGSIITGRVKYFSDEKISNGYLEYEDWLNHRVELSDHWQWVYRECVIASANWMAPKESINFTNDQYPEDYDLVFHWYKNGLKVSAINKVTHLWRDHSRRTSKHSSHYNQNAFFNLKLKRFTSLDYTKNRPLAVMGENKKTKIINNWLSVNKITFTHVTLDHLYKIAELENPLVIVGVFPAPELREGISDFLGGFGLEMGRDWWWF
ncbi:MAG: hypothetical protein Salg2KO_17680 [Salibacteraceae bacterium]